MHAREALVEREAELAAVDEVLARARTGDGQALVVEGNAGIGKTSLLGAAADAAGRLGFTVAAARGGELERELGFGVARDLFRPSLAGAGGDDLLAGTARFAAALVAPAGGPSPEPAVALEALVALTANLAERAPVLLLVDDLHWADTPSLRFAVYLAARLEELRVALVLATRPPGEAELERALDVLRRERSCRWVRPAPLSLEATGVLVARALPQPEAGFTAACHAACAGNPLFLAALLDAARSAGLSGLAAEADGVASLGPEAVGASVRGRLAALPPSARALADAVSVLGLAAELRHAAALASLELSEAADAATALAGADLLRPGEPLEFVHPVVRTTIYGSREGIARRTDHARAAQLLHEAGTPPYELAPHLLAGTRSGEPWIVEALQTAAAEALRRAAPDQAVAFLEHALAVSTHPGGRPALMRALASAEWRAGRETAIEHMRLAVAEERRPGDEYLLVGWLLAARRMREAMSMLDELIAAAPTERDQLRPLAHYVAIAQNAGSPDLPDRARRLRVLVEAFGDDDGPATTVVGWLDVLDANPRGASRLEHVIGRALDGGVRIQQVELWINAAWGLLAAERHALLGRLMDRAIAEARLRASAAMTAMAFATRAQVAYAEGRLGTAEDSARTALEAIARGGPAIFGSGARMALLQCAAETGAQVHEQDTPMMMDEDDFVTALERFGLARLRLAHGDAERGRELLSDCGGRMERALVRSPSYLPWRSHLALSVAPRDQARAVRLATEEAELASLAGTPRAQGCALRALALVSGGDQIDRLQEAVALLSAANAPVEHARALVDLGAAIRRTRRPVAAREPLRDALDIAHACGASRLAQRAMEELHATGARPRTPARHGLEALTGSERRVARLAADGRTNREIAEELFVTVKTVEKHLGGCFRKLDIGTREQLENALRGGTRRSIGP